MILECNVVRNEKGAQIALHLEPQKKAHFNQILDGIEANKQRLRCLSNNFYIFFAKRNNTFNKSERTTRTTFVIIIGS